MYFRHFAPSLASHLPLTFDFASKTQAGFQRFMIPLPLILLLVATFYVNEVGLFCEFCP